jgi:hypothetical protein
VKESAAEQKHWTHSGGSLPVVSLAAFCRFLKNCILKSGYIHKFIPSLLLFIHNAMSFQLVTWKQQCAQLGAVIA